MSKSIFPIFVLVILFALSLNQIVFSQASSSSGMIQAPSIERGNKEGILHEVFASGGQIFYRRSTSYGSKWDVFRKISGTIKTSERPSISVGYSNQSPNSDVLRLVWQQKIDNYNYCLWYSNSNDGGSTWSAPKIVQDCSKVTVGEQQSNDYSGQGPTPVVASFIEYYSEDISDFILVYAAHDGLHYRLCYQSRNNWVIPYRGDIVPGTLNNKSIYFPSLSSYNGRQYHVGLTYSDGSNYLYSLIFKGSLNWSPQDTIDLAGSVSKKLSSLEVTSSKIKNYDLTQNFPNPFNPSTTISYSIPEQAYVTLKVYDILGNEVETLVNEEKPAGIYQVRFNSSLIASGTYFYKIQAGSFIQTKKMILLR